MRTELLQEHEPHGVCGYVGCGDLGQRVWSCRNRSVSFMQFLAYEVCVLQALFPTLGSPSTRGYLH